MGLFSNGQDRSIKTIKRLKQQAHDTNKDIDDILSRFLKNQEKYDSVSDELLLLSKNIKEKLSPTETDTLYALIETVYDLQEEYLNTFRIIASIQEKQKLRIEPTAGKLTTIAEKTSQKFMEARSV
ncbi:hypothetical protein [Marixanthomonas spongiae]|uniref:Uncharacterized protein n=1 Tax=Marixanthomonas spongiae TaxID=2174845 RepID=A0A2U0I7V9_9FLAO|nr:hypothetical protein [Marixanthomonas spongiae]PVW17140.1 hypothetical protein DDV96_01065 [Marixanthomonas spongiae]